MGDTPSSTGIATGNPLAGMGTVELMPVQRQSSLLPGEVRTPSFIVTMSDWGAAPGSNVWESEERSSGQSLHTPLTGYGLQNDVWATESVNSNDDDGIDSAVNAVLSAAANAGAVLAMAGPNGLPVPSQPPLQETPSFTTSTVAALRTSAPTALQPALAGGPTDAMYFRGGGGMQQGLPSQPCAGGTGVFTVHDGASAMGGPQHDFQRHVNFSPHPMQAQQLPLQPPPTQPQQQQQYSSPPPPSRRRGINSITNKQVAHSIVASAGLPLTVTSLIDYIKEGKLDQQFSEPCGATTHHRNYPNLSEAPEAEGPPFDGGGQQRFGSRFPPQFNSHHHDATSTGFVMGARGRGGGGRVQGSYQNPMTGGGWNVQAEQQRGGHPAAAMMQGGSGAGMVSLGPSSLSGPGIQGIPPMGAASRPAQQQQQSPSHSQRSQSNTRPKSESEILSNLLHFHANFFPPPPPPRVPGAERRARAELWYHYAGKWDITHRLPPPPRTPLPEMEIECQMRLQEMTRVPYYGDGWLMMCERWFDVMQSLFDYPEENFGLETDISLVLSNIV